MRIATTWHIARWWMAMTVCVLGVTAPVLTANPVQATSAAGGGGWQAVAALKDGAAVLVERKDASQVRGHVASVHAEYIRVVQPDATVEIPRVAISRVQLIAPRNKKRAVLKGLLIGAAAGAAYGALSTKSSRATWSAGFATAGGGIGAGVGAMLGSRETYRIVYQSERQQEAMLAPVQEERRATGVDTSAAAPATVAPDTPPDSSSRNSFRSWRSPLSPAMNASFDRYPRHYCSRDDATAGSSPGRRAKSGRSPSERCGGSRSARSADFSCGPRHRRPSCIGCLILWPDVEAS